MLYTGGYRIGREMRRGGEANLLYILLYCCGKGERGSREQNVNRWTYLAHFPRQLCNSANRYRSVCLLNRTPSFIFIFNVPGTCKVCWKGRICWDDCTWCHTQVEFAAQTHYLTQPRYTDTGLTSPGTDLKTTGARLCSHSSNSFEVTLYHRSPPAFNHVCCGQMLARPDVTTTKCYHC